MDYKKIYNSLIDRGKNRILEGYKERHHIIPRCVGGSDDGNNLVDLTPEEHYLAHLLLVKIYDGNYSLVRAAAMMVPKRPSNKLYGWLRRRLSAAMSELQSGIGNSQYGTMWIHNKEIKVCKKIPKNMILPDGWEVGRIIDFDAFLKRQEMSNQQKVKPVLTKEQMQQKIKTKHFKFRKTEGYRRAKSIRLYKEFEHSKLSLRKFAESKNMVPMTLSKWFNEFITEYDIVARKSASKQIS